jgi:hypothetical protein
MRFAYLTSDEVNQALALEMAPQCGVTLYPLAPKDGLPDGSYEAVLCDWDSWPAEQRAEFLAALDGLPHRPAAVHGYYLDDGHAACLRDRGVAVHSSLQLEIFRWLCRAASLVRPDGTSVNDQEQDTEGAVRLA